MAVSLVSTGVTFPDNSTQTTAATGFGFKNRIINGGMSVWQRGTSGFTTSGNYSADRWRIAADTSLSTVAQSTDVPTGFKYSLSVAGTGYTNTAQRIEAANTFDLVGQSVTLSFWLKQSTGAGADSIVVALDYANASDNFSGGTTQISSTNISTTSAWAQYTVTFSSLPANTTNGLQVRIYANTASATTYLITGVQLEKGSTATSFDYRPYSTELQLAQRYYGRFQGNGSGNQPSFGTGYAYTTSAAVVTVQFPQAMRASATVSQSQLAVTDSVNYDSNVTSISNQYVGPFSNRLLLNTAGGMTVGETVTIVAQINTSGYVDFSAEL